MYADAKIISVASIEWAMIHLVSEDQVIASSIPKELIRRHVRADRRSGPVT
jgi:hypothetical protein